MRINENTYKRISKATSCIEEIGFNFILFVGKTSQNLGEYNYEVFNNFANMQREIILNAFVSLKDITSGSDGFIEKMNKFPAMMKSDGSKLYSFTKYLEDAVSDLVSKASRINIINNDTSNPIIPDNKDDLYQDLYLEFKSPRMGIYDVNYKWYLLNQYDDEDDVIANILNTYQQEIIQTFDSIIKVLENEFKNLGYKLGLQSVPLKIKIKGINNNIPSINTGTFSASSPKTDNGKIKLNIVKKSCFIPAKQTVHKAKQYDKEKEIEAIIDDVKSGSGRNIDKETALRMWDGINDYSGPEYTDIRSAYNNPHAPDDLKDKLKSIDKYINSAPKWDGTVYRGINLSNKDANEILAGNLIDMKGPSSWSSEENIAQNFSQKMKPINMVFVLNNKSGASITHIAAYNGGESEVLAPSSVRYYIDSYEKIKKNGREYTYVYVHED